METDLNEEDHQASAELHIRTYIHFYLLKSEVKANNIYKLSTTNEQDNKAASCTYSCPLKNR